jgi:hypothetical protein
MQSKVLPQWLGVSPVWNPKDDSAAANASNKESTDKSNIIR